MSAVEVRDLYFYYLTASKTRIWPNVPLSRVTFSHKVALDHINLDFREGCVTALLGRNGSGKTSLMKVLTGARYAQGGTVKVFGENPAKVKHRFGICMGGSLVYHRLSARENLEYFAKLYGVRNYAPKIKELSEAFGFAPAIDNLVETFSFGMKAKLALARAMIHSPDLLLLDEPTLGIDYQLAIQVRAIVKNLKCTVILTTHYMEEANQLADDLVFIDHGTILGAGNRIEMLRRYNADNVGDAYSRAIEEVGMEKKGGKSNGNSEEDYGRRGEGTPAQL